MMTRKRRWLAAVFACGLMIVGVCSVLQLRRAAGHPAEASLLLADAERAAEVGNGLKARQLIARVLELDASNQLARLYHSQFLHEDGKSTAAIGLLADFPDQPPEMGATARFLEGTIALDTNFPRRAEQRFLKAADLNPRFAPPLRELARLQAFELRSLDYRATLNRLSLIRPLNVSELATDLLAGRPVVDAADAVRRLQIRLKNDPQDTMSRLALARYDAVLGDHDSARRELARLHAERPEDEDLRGWLGLEVLETGDLASAIALQPIQDPQSGRPSLGLARYLAKLAVELHDENAAAVNNRALLALAPYDIAPRFNLATILEQAGQTELARKFVEDSQLLDRLERHAYELLRPQAANPELAVPAICSVSDILQHLNQPGKAAEWLAQAVILDPERMDLRDQLLALRRSTGGRSKVEAGSLQLVLPSVANGNQGAVSPPAEGDPEFAPQPLARFEDVTHDAGLNFAYFNGRSGMKLIVETIGGGAAILDYDCDGWPDVYFPQGKDLRVGAGPLPELRDRLFRNLGNGRFIDVTTAAGLGDLNHTLGCAVGDVDNDGDPDLFIANLGRNVLYVNNGDGTFVDATPQVVAERDDCSSAAAFGDFDDDGFLDLYVVNYVQNWERLCRNSRGEIATCDPNGFPACQDRLYRNSGAGEWNDVTAPSGIERPNGKGLGIVVVDVDGDGRVDLYVANDGAPNFLFRNQSTPGQLQFDEIGYSAGVAVDNDGRSQAGMGIACADFDGNGWPDLFVTNFFQETNVLYANQGQGQFVDATRRSGLAAPSRDVLGFGTQAIDIDQDGDEDLFVANGDIDNYHLRGRPWKMLSQVFSNRGQGRFSPLLHDLGHYFLNEVVGRGVARLDVNRDGRDDLVIVHHDQDATLLRCQTLGPFRSLRLRLHGLTGNRDAIGARVATTIQSRERVRWLQAGDGFSSSNERLLTIGMGEAETVDRLEITWPGGHRDVYEHVRGDLDCVEGEPVRERHRSLAQ